MLKDLLFSYFFVFLAVAIGGFALKVFYFGNALNALLLIVASIYFFGIGCMGFNTLDRYARGRCNNAETS